LNELFVRCPRNKVYDNICVDEVRWIWQKKEASSLNFLPDLSLFYMKNHFSPFPCSEMTDLNAKAIKGRPYNPVQQSNLSKQTLL